VGLGDQYCEIKVVPGEIDEVGDSLQAMDHAVLDRMHHRLMDGLMGFLLEEKPLAERPKLGSEVGLTGVFHTMVHPALAGERYRTAMRMAGVKGGKDVAEHLVKAGMEGDQAVSRLLHFLEYCRIGRVTAGQTIIMKESCESFWTSFITRKKEEPTCLFTTGFLNGFFSKVKDQHAKETRCIGMGDPYCEWEFR
jgi:predicted hydrocarbon binding protein